MVDLLNPFVKANNIVYEVIKNRNKSVLKIFLSILLVVAVMFLANFIAFKSIISFSDKQIKANDYLSFEKTVESFEYCFKSVNDIFTTLDIFDSNAQRINGSISRIDAYNIKKDLSKIISINEFIDEIVIFFSDQNLLVTSSGTAGFENFFSAQYYNSQYSTRYWKNFSQTKHPIKLIPASDYRNTYDITPSNIKRLIGVIGSNQIGNPQLNELVFIDVPKLLQKVRYNSSIIGSSLIILDNNNNIILSTDTQNDLDQIEYFYDSKNNMHTSSKEYDFYSIKSTYSNFQYISKTPKKSLVMSSAVKINSWIMFISVFIGILLAIYLTSYLYKPVKNILVLLGTANFEKMNDAFLYISSKVFEMQKEHESLEKKLKQMRLEVNDNLLLQSITGFHDIRTELSEDINMLDFKHFIMISFDVFRVNIQESEYDQVRMILDNKIIQDLQDSVNGRFQYYKIFQEEPMKFVAIIGDNQILNRNEVICSVKMLCHELNEMNSENYNIIVNISRTYCDIHDYHKAYNDIITSRVYRNMKLSKGTVDVETIDCMKEVYIYVPVDFKDRLINYIISGEFKKCVDYIDDILKQNIERDIYYAKFIDVARIIFNNMRDALIFCGCEKDAVNHIEKTFFELIDRMLNYEDIKMLFKKLVKQVEGKLAQNTKGKMNKSFIIQYINLHYMEDLYLDNLAEIVGTSPKYFSKFFKKEFNVNFVEFLNNIRISHAKRYLKDLKISVGDVGVKVGFSNPSTFASTFKKNCGVTPKEYRELNNLQ